MREGNNEWRCDDRALWRDDKQQRVMNKKDIGMIIMELMMRTNDDGGDNDNDEDDSDDVINSDNDSKKWQ